MDRIEHWPRARGFVYPGSEIYSGLANTWDYGNLGVELKKQRKAHGGKSSSWRTRTTWVWTVRSS